MNHSLNRGTTKETIIIIFSNTRQGRATKRTIKQIKRSIRFNKTTINTQISTRLKEEDLKKYQELSHAHFIDKQLVPHTILLEACDIESLFFK